MDIQQKWFMRQSVVEITIDIAEHIYQKGDYILFLQGG